MAVLHLLKPGSGNCANIWFANNNAMDTNANFHDFNFFIILVKSIHLWFAYSVLSAYNFAVLKIE
jgi:hypothetical protein